MFKDEDKNSALSFRLLLSWIFSLSGLSSSRVTSQNHLPSGSSASDPRSSHTNTGGAASSTLEYESQGNMKAKLFLGCCPPPIQTDLRRKSYGDGAEGEYKEF
jgi:hypothetical protein